MIVYAGNQFLVLTIGELAEPLRRSVGDLVRQPSAIKRVLAGRIGGNLDDVVGKRKAELVVRVLAMVRDEQADFHRVRLLDRAQISDAAIKAARSDLRFFMN